MVKVKEPICLRNYGFSENNPIELCIEGYRLENGLEVMYINGKWMDSKENEYTAVTMGEIVGFNRKNTLTKHDKQILNQSPEGRAFIKYNELIGGDNLGLNVPWGYPPSVQDYLDEGHTIEEIYRECIKAMISWEERFSCYIESDPTVNDSYVVEVLWD